MFYLEYWNQKLTQVGHSENTQQLRSKKFSYNRSGSDGEDKFS